MIEIDSSKLDLEKLNGLKGGTFITEDIIEYMKNTPLILKIDPEDKENLFISMGDMPSKMYPLSIFNSPIKRLFYDIRRSYRRILNTLSHKLWKWRNRIK